VWQVAWTLILLGVIAVVLAALADPLGIGSGGFGWHQALLLAVGLVMVVVGAVLARRAATTGGLRDSTMSEENVEIVWVAHECGT
jgi:hypothetical protein